MTYISLTTTILILNVCSNMVILRLNSNLAFVHHLPFLQIMFIIFTISVFLLKSSWGQSLIKSYIKFRVLYLL